MTEAVAARMTELMIDVAEAAEAWTREAVEPGSKAESDAHEELLHAILTFADEYRGFESITQALHPSSPESIDMSGLEG